MPFHSDLLLILGLVLLNGFFALSELAIISARKLRLRLRAQGGQRGARVALRLAERPGRFLSTVQIGITLVGITSGVLGGEELTPALRAFFERFPILADWSEQLATLCIVAGITYASVIFGELVPKRMALRFPEPIAAFVARPMALLDVLARPVVWILEASSGLVLFLLGMRGTPTPAMTEEEMRAVIAQGAAQGIIAPSEHEMIAGVMRLGDWRVGALMTPRREVEWVDIQADEPTLRQRLAETPYSRLLVARGGLDHPLGIVQAKDLLGPLLHGQPVRLHELLREPLYVPADVLAIELVERLKRAPVHLAVVVDALGAVEGIVTATDLLQTLVGGFVEAGHPEESPVVHRADGSLLLSGDLHVDVLKELLGRASLPDEERYDTLAGFLLSRLERLPSPGDRLEWEGFQFEILDLDGLRIDKVLLANPRPAPARDADGVSR